MNVYKKKLWCSFPLFTTKEFPITVDFGVTVMKICYNVILSNQIDLDTYLENKYLLHK